MAANGQKTLWEREKLLVKSNFSFSQGVFKRLVLQTRKNQTLFGIGLSTAQNMQYDFSSTLSTLPKHWRNKNNHELVIFLDLYSRHKTSFRLGIFGLTLYQTMTTSDALEESLLKTWQKNKMLVTSIFFFSHNVFFPMEDKFNILSNI